MPIAATVITLNIEITFGSQLVMAEQYYKIQHCVIVRLLTTNKANCNAKAPVSKPSKLNFKCLIDAIKSYLP